MSWKEVALGKELLSLGTYTGAQTINVKSTIPNYKELTKDDFLADIVSGYGPSGGDFYNNYVKSYNNSIGVFTMSVVQLNGTGYRLPLTYHLFALV